MKILKHTKKVKLHKRHLTCLQSDGLQKILVGLHQLCTHQAGIVRGAVKNDTRPLRAADHVRRVVVHNQGRKWVRVLALEQERLAQTDGHHATVFSGQVTHLACAIITRGVHVSRAVVCVSKSSSAA